MRTRQSEITHIHGTFQVRLDEHTANCGVLTLLRRGDGSATLSLFGPHQLWPDAATVPVASIELASETARALWSSLTTV